MGDRTGGSVAKIWRDGELIDWTDANIHIMSHVAHYGSSVFEGMRCYETPAGGAVFRLREHMERLHASCRVYRMPLRYSVEELMQATVDTVAANELRHCYIRPLVVRAGEQMDFYPVDIPLETFIICWRLGARLLAHDVQEGGGDVCVSSWRRAAPDTYPVMAKAGGNYLNSQLSLIEARQNGYHESISLDVHGWVSEGTGANLFAVRHGVLYTAPLAASILQGITRDSVIQLAHDLGYQVREENIPREFLHAADELFFCGTAVEIWPIRSVDRVPVGAGTAGPVTRAIREEYMAIAKGHAPDRHNWLTPVPAGALSGNSTSR